MNIEGGMKTENLKRGESPNSDRRPLLARAVDAGGVAALLCGFSFLSSCGVDGASSGRTMDAAIDRPVPAVVTQISMRSLKFFPETIDVTKGTVVEWKNDDIIPHTATAPTFDSGTLLSGQSWRYAFTNTGTFTYVCKFHTGMKGAINVK